MRSLRYGEGKYPQIKPATADQVLQVVAQIEQGHTIAAACRLMGINPATLYVVCEMDPEVQALVDHARVVAADTLAEEAITVTDTEPDPRRARVRSDSRKWGAEMANRKRYGRQLDLTVTSHVDVAGPLEEARTRARLRPVSDQPEIVELEQVGESNTYASRPDDCQSPDPAVVPPALLDIFK